MFWYVRLISRWRLCSKHHDRPKHSWKYVCTAAEVAIYPKNHIPECSNIESPVSSYSWKLGSMASANELQRGSSHTLPQTDRLCNCTSDTENKKMNGETKARKKPMKCSTTDSPFRYVSDTVSSPSSTNTLKPLTTSFRISSALVIVARRRKHRRVPTLTHRRILCGDSYRRIWSS
jgi:hypothetical protein